MIFEALFISLLIQFVFFIPAYFFQTDKLTDASYGLTFIILSFIFVLRNEVSMFSEILFCMILLWALRLSVFLVIRIRKIGKDTRFDSMRHSFVRFGGFWVLQGISVWIILLSSVLFFEAEMILFNGWMIVGFLVWLFGLLFESVADYQKFVFKNKKQNKGKWTSVGLWHYSRHPNYFGEMLVWMGIFLYTVSMIDLWFVGILSPLYIILLLRFVSGVPPLERRYEQTFGKNKKYQEYKENTNLLIPKLF